MKRLIIFLALLCCCISVSNAKTVKYSQNGITMNFNVIKKDTIYCVIVSFNSAKYQFLVDPVIKIRTFNDKVLTLNGVILNDNQKTTRVFIEGFILPVRSKSLAQFFVTPEQFEDIKSGVSKIQYTLMPEKVEHKFKKDKIGEKIYQLYLNEKNDNF